VRAGEKSLDELARVRVQARKEIVRLVLCEAVVVVSARSATNKGRKERGERPEKSQQGGKQ
jgi:hypothetical protein